jgi:CHASE3 domain sensor protein
MKTLLLTALSVIIIMIMSLTPNQESYQEYEELIVETKTLTDSAIICLKMLHDHNDSLLDRYFPKDTIQIK